MKLIYVAHPFGGDKSNLDKAEKWVADLSQRFDAIFWAPWIPLCRHWVDSGESRKRGLEIDLAAVRCSDAVIAVGGFVSPGMNLEIEESSASLDATLASRENVWRFIGEFLDDLPEPTRSAQMGNE